MCRSGTWRGFSVQPLKINRRFTEPPIITNYSFHHEWCGTVNICLRVETSNYNPLEHNTALSQATKSKKVRRLKLLNECWQRRYICCMNCSLSTQKDMTDWTLFQLICPSFEQEADGVKWLKKKVTATMSFWEGHQYSSFQHNGNGFVCLFWN